MKTKMLILNSLILVFFYSCNEPTPYVGAEANGGYVFYVNGEERYKLIAPTVNLLDPEGMSATLLRLPWDSTYLRPFNPFNVNESDSPAKLISTSKEIGKGWSNTKAVVRSIPNYKGMSKFNNAVKYTFLNINYSDNGIKYSDWFLPSVDEFQILLDNINNTDLDLKSKIFVPDEDWYWTSTQLMNSEEKAYAFKRNEVHPFNYELKEDYKIFLKSIYPIRMEYY